VKGFVNTRLLTLNLKIYEREREREETVNKKEEMTKQSLTPNSCPSENV